VIKLYLLLFISFVLVVSLKSNDGFPEQVNHGNFFPYLVDKPHTEDGFYMMTIAWHIAEGNGIKYNLNRPTTGFQPLFAFVQAGIAKLVLLSGGDKIDFLRVMIIFSSVLLFIFSFAAGNVIKKIIPGLYSPVIMIFLVLFCFELFYLFNNGLETGFYLIMISLCIWYSFYFIENPGGRQVLIFGSLAGITALTRVDFLLPLFFYLLFLYFAKKTNPVKLLLVLTIAPVFLIPWLIYVYNVSGSIFPSSVLSHTSLVELSGIGERFYHILRAFFHHLSPFLHTHNLFISAGAAVIYSVVFYFLVKKMNFLNIVDKTSLRNLAGWGISFFILGIAYFVYSPAQHFYIRYTAPFYLVIFIIAVSSLIFLLSEVPGLYRKLLPAAFVVFFFVQSFHYHFNGKLLNSLTMRIAYIESNFNKPGLIGMFQSGVSGFFLDNVLNLDGKVDHVAHNYMTHRKLNKFLDSMMVNVIIEWREGFKFSINDFESSWKVYDENIGDDTTSCYVRIY
jgi:hypothetical protein